MAEDDGKDKKKSGMMKWLVIGVVALALIGGGGYFALGMMSPKTEISDKEAKTKDAVKNGPAPLFDMPPFIVNLAGSKGRRYLKVKISVELNEAGVQKEIESRMPQVRDQIITLLSGKSYEDVQDSLGKNRLRREIVSRVNRVLKTGKAQRIYLTEFVIQ